MTTQRRSAIVRLHSYYRVFRTQLSPTKSLYFAIRLAF